MTVKSHAVQSAREDGETQGSGLRSVQRCIAVLTAFSRQEPELTLTELADRAGLDPSTALRYTRALADAGLLRRSADMSYTLGLQLVELAQICISQLDIRGYALPTMKRIRDELNETVLLSVRSGNFRVVIEQVEGFKEFRRTGGVGQHIPLHLGSPSLVLLSSLTDEELADYAAWSEAEHPESAPSRTGQDLAAAVAAIRADGYCETLNQRGIGGAGVAAPIRDRNGDVVGALNVAALLSEWPEIGGRARALVIAGAAEISRLLGYEPTV